MRAKLFFRVLTASVICACMIFANLAGEFIHAQDSYEYVGEDTIRTSVNADANPDFTIQHYFWFPQVARGDTGATLPFIDTENDTNPGENRGGKLPKNSGMKGTGSLSNYNGDWDIFNVELTQDDSTDGQYRLKTVDVLTPLFADEATSYRENPQIAYMNRLYNGINDYNKNYTLTEVWVYQPTKTEPATPAENLTPEQFVVYTTPAEKSDNGVITQRYPERIRFTNNPANPNLTLNDKGEPNASITGVTKHIRTDPTDNNGAQTIISIDSPARGGYTEAYPYNYTILIQENTVIRLVFEVTTGEAVQPANFFDYDITDGYVYTGTNGETRLNDRRVDKDTEKNVSYQKQNPGAVLYADTYRQGINSPGNYKEAGARYAFGNSNTGMGWIDQTFNGARINIWNNFSGGANSTLGTGSSGYGGAAFGLVKGVKYSGDKTADGGAIDATPVFVEGISAPNIFGREYTEGKTVYASGEYSLGFFRQGGTYTLSSVRDNAKNTDVAQNLRDFKIMAENSSIYSNQFWPMDGSPSHGTDNHDLLFGDTALESKRLFARESERGAANFNYNDDTLPTADDRQGDHNAYFGMSYAIDFTIDPGYVSPLEYWFYGDDDMWVFLDQPNNPAFTPVPVADIGGVHSSIGSYVNLWDYIPKIPIDSKTGSQTYRLTVFFTERGASGSTCYMRFTVPLDSTVSYLEPYDDEIIIEKILTDYNGDVTADAANGLEDARRFVFLLTLETEGAAYQDMYSYEKYWIGENHLTAVPHEKGAVGDEIYEDSGGTIGGEGEYVFHLYGGEYIILTDLPPGTEYSVREVTDKDYITRFRVGVHNHATIDGQEVHADSLGAVEAAQSGNTVGTPTRLKAEQYNYVRFINGPAVKTETNPGEGKSLQTGDFVIYEIEWANDTGEKADITISDILDTGIDFIGAKFGSSRYRTNIGISDAAPEYEYYSENDYSLRDPGKYSDSDGNTIEYDPDSHTVTWTLSNTGKGLEGVVSLMVRVNKKALEPEESEGDYGYPIPRVENRANIRIGEDTNIWTNTVENPVWEPEKTEPEPGDGKRVEIGDLITYEIDWLNTERYPATITVSDTLDPGLDFISAEFTDLKLTSAGGDTEHILGFGENDGVTISYSKETRSVVWTLKNRKPGEGGKVVLTVRVNDDIKIGWEYKGEGEGGYTGENDDRVFNKAGVKIGSNPVQYTNIVTNYAGDGTLTVSKTVTGSHGDRNKEFTFTVTLSDVGINGEYGDMTFESGVATFTLKHGESKTARNLPVGISYTTVEKEANRDGYSARSSGTAGIIDADGAQASFVNNKSSSPNNPGVSTDKPSNPTDKPNNPPNEPSAPTERPDNPPNESSAPTERPDNPSNESGAPGGKPHDPPDKPDNPSGERYKPTDKINPPKTGDESHLMLWEILMALSVFGMVIITAFLRKH